MAQSDKTNSFLLGSFSTLANSLYYLSFEPTGILFMEINLIYQFQNKDFFIKYSDLSNISLGQQPWKIFNGHSKLYFASLKLSDKKANNILLFSLWKRSPLPAMLSNNYQNIKNIINKLNISEHSIDSQLISDKKRFCPNCGNKLDLNAKFCPNCGTQIS